MKYALSLIILSLLAGCTHTRGIENCDAQYDEPKRQGSLVTLTGGLENTFSETLENDHRYDKERVDWRCKSPLMLDDRIKQMLEKIDRTNRRPLKNNVPSTNKPSPHQP